MSTVATSLPSAIANMNSWRDVLMGVFNMAIKPDSLVGLSSLSRNVEPRTISIDGDDWSILAEDRVLGCTVSGTGNPSSEMKTP